jgi:ABC-type multidrug transport system fused ATPase/permease subunit
LRRVIGRNRPFVLGGKAELRTGPGSKHGARGLRPPAAGGLESEAFPDWLSLVASEHLVEIRNLTYAYGARPVLQNIDMAIPRGKVVAIMGISGSGKTTILRLIGGVLRARRGEVIFDGQQVDPRKREQLYRLRRRMGMLFQFGALFTDLSVFDNVAFQIREHTPWGCAPRTLQCPANFPAGWREGLLWPGRSPLIRRS